MPGPVLFPTAKSITKLPSTWREAKSDTVVSVTVKVQIFNINIHSLMALLQYKQ